MPFKQILAYILFGFSLLFYVIFAAFLIANKQEDSPGKVKAFLVACLVFLIAGTGLQASIKSENSNLSKQDYMSMAIVGISILLVAASFYNDCGYFVAEMSTIVGILAGSSLIFS